MKQSPAGACDATARMAKVLALRRDCLARLANLSVTVRRFQLPDSGLPGCCWHPEEPAAEGLGCSGSCGLRRGQHAVRVSSLQRPSQVPSLSLGPEVRLDTRLEAKQPVLEETKVKARLVPRPRQRELDLRCFVQVAEMMVVITEDKAKVGCCSLRSLETPPASDILKAGQAAVTKEECQVVETEAQEQAAALQFSCNSNRRNTAGS